jgi:4-alpha-glucanotransferase
MTHARPRRSVRSAPSDAPGSALATLAERVGIAREFVGHEGRQRTGGATRRAILTALGFDVASERAAERSLDRFDRERSDEPLAPTRVVRATGRRAVPLEVRRPRALSGPLALAVEVESEDGLGGRTGERWRFTLRMQQRAARGTVPLPRLEPGYYRLRATFAASARSASAEQLLVVAPARCIDPEEKAADRSFGIAAHRYSVRSRTSWGVGDLGDLRRLARWARELGASFVGINPLHALRIADGEVSPYSPDSRLFRSEVYLEVAAVPELADHRRADRLLAGARFRRALAAARAGSRIDYARVWELKEPILRDLHRVFARLHRDRATPRGRAYRAFLAEQGRPLEEFATFRMLASRHGGDWRRWPRALRAPGAAAVARARRAHPEEVDFHRFLQFELDRQLGEAARAADLPIGLYQDLAIGSSPAGSDAWSFHTSFVRDVHLGAPPDPFQAEGQDWAVPPLDPLALARDGYRYWILLLRAAFRHAGALRIDHVMGLARQFWVPAGRSPREGAYVRFPFDDLAGILALESRRAGATVIGEDLGTVPAGFRADLARWGILSSRVLLFERDRRGRFHPPRRYPRGALVTANTHDLPPLRSFWEGRDIELRREAGAIADAALARERRERERARRALHRLLVDEGGLAREAGAKGDGRVRGAAHAVLSRTPAALVGVSLDDLSGEREPVNLPGIPATQFPSWTRRMSVPLERLASDPEARRALGGVGDRRLRRRARRRVRSERRSR